jgi:hypothetical protein
MKSTMTILPHALLLMLLYIAATYQVFANEQVYHREYTYTATEADDLVSAATVAHRQMCNLLLRETGVYISSRSLLVRQEGQDDVYAEMSECITAGVLKTTIIREEWNPPIYYVEADIALDTAEVQSRIIEVMNDIQKTKDLEDAHQRIVTAEAEVMRRRQE